MGSLWQYVLVFLAAAVPFVEVLVVIPGSVAAGLEPVPVGVAAFLGNAATLVLAVVAADELAAWAQRRRHARRSRRERIERVEARRARRLRRVRRIAQRWGLPGLAVLAPVTVGSHLGALGAVALRLPRRAVLAWSVAGVAAWSLVLVVLSAAGRELV